MWYGFGGCDLPEAIQSDRRVALGPYLVELEVGDVAADAGIRPVVSSDDNYLSHGGGVSAAIWGRVGDDLRRDEAVRAVRKGQRPRLGEVVTSLVGIGEVPVFHAITIDFDLGVRLSRNDLGLLYTNLLNAADLRGATELILPAVGAGTAGLSAGDSIAALLDIVAGRAFLTSGQQLVVRVLPRVLAECVGVIDAWQGRHRPQPSAPVVPDPVASSLHRSSAASVGVTRPRAGSTYDGFQRGSRWESMASAGGFNEAVVEAAKALDGADNAHAAVPALRLWSRLFELGEQPSPASRDRAAVLGMARSARNRIAQGGGDTAALLPDLLRGIEILLNPEDVDLPLDDAVGAIVGLVRVGWDRDGTKHVRELHGLLQTTLTSGQVEAESKRLGDIGYRGTPLDRLLENCVSDDPVDVLQRHFAGSQLQAMLTERGIPAALTESSRQLARRLLHQLGFPRRDELVDPELVRADVEVLSSEVPTLAEAQLMGRITGISRAIESVLRTYLRFLTSGLLNKPPDMWLADRISARPKDPLPKTVERATLGQLAVLVRAAGKEIDNDQDPRTQARVDGLRDESGRVRWLPARVDELVKHRNVWVHGSDSEADSTLPIAEKRRQAREFCQLAQLILDGLIKGPFPDVIVIEEIKYDNWGRRRVRARTSKGTYVHIFTDQDLVPGQTYLMHSRTHPMSIDPLLVRQATEA